MSEVLVSGCFFEGGYARDRGAGISLGYGNISVLDSVFYDNVAGGDNEKGGESEPRLCLGSMAARVRLGMVTKGGTVVAGLATEGRRRQHEKSTRCATLNRFVLCASPVFDAAFRASCFCWATRGLSSSFQTGMTWRCTPTGSKLCLMVSVRCKPATIADGSRLAS